MCGADIANQMCRGPAPGTDGLPAALSNVFNFDRHDAATYKLLGDLFPWGPARRGRYTLIPLCGHGWKGWSLPTPPRGANPLFGTGHVGTLR